MIITLNLAILILSGAPIQAILCVLLASANLEVRGGDTNAPGTLTLHDPSTGFDLELTGNDLVADPATNTFSGTVDSIRVKDDSGANVADITLPTATSLRDMVDTARSIPDPVTPGNIDPFNDVIMPDPSPFPDLFLTDGDFGNSAMGFDDNDTFNMNGGRDTVYMSAGNDTFNGGGGKDLISAEFLGHSVDINLGAGTASFGPGIGGSDVAAHHAGTTTMTSVENAVGSAMNDTIKGSAKDNNIRGLGGDDSINGASGGNNKLYGDGGNDTIRGGNDGDFADGGTGNDVIIGRNGNDRLLGGAGRDTLEGGNGRDTLIGGAKADDISGGSKKDIIKGGAGGDRLLGGSGNDVIRGDAGHDRIRGGNGNDFIVGGTGKDTLSGNGGNDTFVFQAGDGIDRITDFDIAADQIRMVGIVDADVSVSNAGGNTIVDYGAGSVILLGQVLTKSDIAFDFV